MPHNIWQVYIISYLAQRYADYCHVCHFMSFIYAAIQLNLIGIQLIIMHHRAYVDLIHLGPTFSIRYAFMAAPAQIMRFS